MEQAGRRPDLGVREGPKSGPVVLAWPNALILRPSAQLVLTSLLGLYVELLCIRWMPAHVRYLSYFTNFTLLASFLGLGVGILSARRRLPLGPKTFPWLLLGVAVLVAATKLELRLGSLGVLYYGAAEGGEFLTENTLVLPAAFLLVSVLFVAIGRPLGLLIATVTPPLRAYGWDIAGSLLGIAGFFVLSLTEQPPGRLVRRTAAPRGATDRPALARCAPDARPRRGGDGDRLADRVGLLLLAVLQDRPDAYGRRHRLPAERQ